MVLIEKKAMIKRVKRLFLVLISYHHLSSCLKLSQSPSVQVVKSFNLVNFITFHVFYTCKSLNILLKITNEF